MTTIATDGKTMAGDSQITGGGQILGSKTKIIHLPDGSIFGATGFADETTLLCKWLFGEIEKPTLSDDCAALILTPEGKVFWIGKNLERVEWCVPATIGSGGDIALGAMLAGKTPHEAVRISAMRDVATGGDIVSLSLTTPA